VYNKINESDFSIMKEVMYFLERKVAKMRKGICILLTFVMIFLMAIPVFGASDESAQLEKIVKAVKSVITIPAEYTEFEYEIWDYDEDKNTRIWDLYWSNSEFSYINVEVDDNGIISRYYNMDHFMDELGTPNVSEMQAKEAAKAFITKVIPPGLSDIRFSGSDTSYSDYIFLDYNIYVNDIPIDFLETFIVVDGFSGEVISYYFEGSYSNHTFPKATGMIGDGAAKAAFIEKLAPKLSCISNNNWRTEERNVIPVFEDVSNAKYIDAFTGNVAEMYSDYYDNYYYNYYYDYYLDNFIQGKKLTQQEQVKALNEGGLISQTDAVKRIKQQAPTIDSNVVVYSADLYYNAEQKIYSWEINFNDDSYGIINAKTGELISFDVYGYFANKTTEISKEKAMGSAENYLKSISSDKWKQVVFSEKWSSTWGDYYEFCYSRIVNGVEYDNNYMLVYVGKWDGKIYGYESNWYADVELPSIEGAMSALKAYEIIAAYRGFGLKYVLAEDGKVALGYGFLGSESEYIDPFTGEFVIDDRYNYGYRTYSDISGKWYEAIVTELLEAGYYIESDTFSGKDQITQTGFLQFLHTPRLDWYDSRYEFYEMLMESGIVKEDDQAPNQLLTRQDAAKFVVRYLGESSLAERGELFKNPYNDVIPAEYLGYASIVKALNIMQGDTKGNFSGSRILTNVEAAVIIYNILNYERSRY